MQYADRAGLSVKLRKPRGVGVAKSLEVICGFRLGLATDRVQRPRRADRLCTFFHVSSDVDHWGLGGVPAVVKVGGSGGGLSPLLAFEPPCNSMSPPD